MRTVEIPGGSAELRETAEIRVRHRRLIETAAVAAGQPVARIEAMQKDGKNVQGVDLLRLGLTRQEASQVMEMQDAVIVATLASWTLPDELPTMDTIGDLEQPLYDALSAATRAQGAAIASRVDFDAHPDQPGFEVSPTVPSDASEQASRADQASELTAPQSNVGPSTGTVESSPV